MPLPAVHVVYGGADLFRASISRRLGDVALATLGEFAPDAFTFARAIGLPGAEALPKSGKQAAAAERQFAKSPEALWGENRAALMAQTIYSRVLEKLQREPVEDFRIDFEGGHGNRSDAEEDQHAKLARRGSCQGMGEGSLPTFIGIRLKPFSSPEMRDRGIRTLSPSLRMMGCPKNFSSIFCRDQSSSRKSVASTGRFRFSIPDPVAFFQPFTKRFESRFTHHRLEWNPARAGHAF